MNIFSFVYLAVFLLAGFCIARRALPQAGLSVSIPLGCGFGVSLLAFVPADRKSTRLNSSHSV